MDEIDTCISSPEGRRQSFDIRGSSKTGNFTPKVSSSFCQKTQKISEGATHSFQSGTKFCKNFRKFSSLMSFVSVNPKL